VSPTDFPVSDVSVRGNLNRPHPNLLDVTTFPSPPIGLVVPGAGLHIDLNDTQGGVLEDDVSLTRAVDVGEHLTPFPGSEEVYPLLGEITKPAAINGSQTSLILFGIQSRVGT